jgi:hypothetical protein
MLVAMTNVRFRGLEKLKRRHLTSPACPQITLIYFKNRIGWQW